MAYPESLESEDCDSNSGERPEKRHLNAHFEQCFSSKCLINRTGDCGPFGPAPKSAHGMLLYL